MYTLNKVAFLDRDGTIARDVHYCRQVEDFEILLCVPDVIRLSNGGGYKVVVITNRSGIVRGYFTEDTLAEIHAKTGKELSKYDVCVDAVYYCPHRPDDGYACSRPIPGLVLQAAADFRDSLELYHFFVGDMLRDVAAGKAAGCTTVLLSASPSYTVEEFEKLLLIMSLQICWKRSDG